MQELKFAENLDKELSALSLKDRIELISMRFSRPIFTTSLGMEDQVLAWAIALHGKLINIATLQTGRLFPETISLIDLTKKRYNVSIEEYTPQDSSVIQYISQHGKNGFYDSIEARKQCCDIRKVAPLENALKGSDAWITGLRREQSTNRKSTPMAEWDSSRQLMKLNPLADWTLGDIKSVISKFDIPINELHSRNYPSIGCEPCTRAIKPGEPERAGRWWWEQDQKQECGLHVAEAFAKPDGTKVGATNG